MSILALDRPLSAVCDPDGNLVEIAAAAKTEARSRSKPPSGAAHMPVGDFRGAGRERE